VAALKIERHIATRLAAERVRIAVCLAERGFVKPDLTAHFIRELEREGVPHGTAVSLIRFAKRRGIEMAAERERLKEAAGL
jgi:hypothetical protein